MNDLAQRLDALDLKLDRLVFQQDRVVDLVREMTPVGREVLGSLAEQLAGWEDRGWLDLLPALTRLLEALADAVEPDDVDRLSASLVALLETLRHVTQPEVLDFANDAADVLQHADEVKGVSPFRLALATRDDDVQKGLGLALEILKHLGRARGAASSSPRSARAVSTAAPKASVSPAKAPPKAPITLTPAAAPVVSDVVEWEGLSFTSQGFLLDPKAWTPELAEKMAEGLQLTLTEAHWVVLRWTRDEYFRTHASPNVRRIATGSGVGIQDLYTLFPSTPGKTVAMLAGVPKPVGCV